MGTVACCIKSLGEDWMRKSKQRVVIYNSYFFPWLQIPPPPSLPRIDQHRRQKGSQSVRLTNHMQR